MSITDYQVRKNKPLDMYDPASGESHVEYSADAWPKGETLKGFPEPLVGHGFGRTQTEAFEDAVASAMRKAKDFLENPDKYL